VKSAKFAAGFTSGMVKTLRADPDAAHELAHKLEGNPCPLCFRRIDPGWCTGEGPMP